MRISVLVTRAVENVVERRQQDQPPPPDPAGSQGKFLIVAVVIVSILLFSLFVYASLRTVRRTRPEPPRWLPQSIKAWWTKWRPGTYVPTPVSETAASSVSSRHTDRPTTTNSESHRDRTRTHNQDRDRDRHRTRETQTQGIDRNTSIRSIMTLPEYRPVAAPGKERTIGREGERAGIDTVIEFPETSAEEEQRREEHMQALYEIRRARQIQRARESAVAGSRRSRLDSSPSGGDQGRRDGSSSTSLVAALAAVTEREQRLSNVAYAEVGLARPDGSRVRAGSTASDNQPLLSSGASMGHTRNISIDSVEMFSARPSIETRPRVSSDTRFASGQQVRSMLDVDRGGHSPPPSYGSPPLESPPDYERLHDSHGGHINMQVPLLRVEAASPESPRLPTYPAPTR